MKRLKSLILVVLVLLVVCGCEPTVDELIEQLKRGYISKEEAVDALVRIGTPVVESLIGALRDKDWRVREAAAWALGKIGDERAVEPLIATLRDKDSDVRKAAASALEKINPNWHTTEEAKRQVSEFIAALRDENSYVREAAASALEKINPNWHTTEEAKKQVSEFIAALRDEDENVRKAAADALVKIGTPAVEPLIAALRDEDWRVREVAASALGKIGDERAVKPLIIALGDKDEAASKFGLFFEDIPQTAVFFEVKDWRVRAAAASALGKIGDKRAVEPLIAALRDEYRCVREAAACALEKINPNWHTTEEAKRQVPKFITALGDRDSNVRKGAASALVMIGISAVEPLITALRDKDSYVREAAACALEKINPNWHTTEEAKRQVPEFIAALRDKDSYVREAAACALEKINPNWHTTEEAKRQVPEFIAALRDKDWRVREAAASALGKIGDKKAIPALVLHLRDWYAGGEVADALDGLGWQPTTDEEKVHYLVAKRKVNELKHIWNITKRVLLKDIESNSNDYRVIENAVHALLSIEKREIIQELINILNRKGTKEMAEVYLNYPWPSKDKRKIFLERIGNIPKSPDPELFKAAEFWAKWHGYRLQYEINRSLGEERWKLFQKSLNSQF
jgi:HEAT repeat protein